MYGLQLGREIDRRGAHSDQRALVSGTGIIKRFFVACGKFPSVELFARRR